MSIRLWRPRTLVLAWSLALGAVALFWNVANIIYRGTSQRIGHVLGMASPWILLAPWVLTWLWLKNRPIPAHPALFVIMLLIGAILLLLWLLLLAFSLS